MKRRYPLGLVVCSTVASCGRYLSAPELQPENNGRVAHVAEPLAADDDYWGVRIVDDGTGPRQVVALPHGIAPAAGYFNSLKSEA